MIRWFSLALVVLVGPTATAEDSVLASELDVPYQWRVLVQFEPHPYFANPSFRDRVLRAVRGTLQPALEPGSTPVGRVEVRDLSTLPETEQDALTKEFLKQGWPALEARTFRTLTGVKTHFLRLMVGRDGTFTMEARQHDGSTGLTSPAIRTTTTRDPQEVGRLAGLILERDFGPVGTIEKLSTEKNRVRVHFRGGKLPGFERFVKVGDVFAVAVVSEPPRPASTRTTIKGPTPPAPRQADPRLYTFLQADTEVVDGSSLCRIVSRFENSLPSGRGIIGWRCLKLATVEANVAIKVVGSDGAPPMGVGLIQVRASDTDFSSGNDPRDNLELRNGTFRSARPLRNLACVWVALGTGRLEPFPVPVLDQGPVTVRFEVNPQQAARAAFERECEDFRGRVAEARTAQIGLLNALFKLIDKGDNIQALSRATTGLDALTAMSAELTADLDRLKSAPEASDASSSSVLQSAERQIQDLKNGRELIAKRVETLKEAVAKLDDPAQFEREFRARELAARIKQLLDAGEVPEALPLYDQLAQVTGSDEHKQAKAKVEAAWRPRNDEHKKARDFLLITWRNLPAALPDYRDAMPRLEEAVERMIRNDDRYGLRNFLASMDLTLVRLKEIADGLDANVESDKPRLKELEGILAQLRKIEENARDVVKRIEEQETK